MRVDLNNQIELKIQTFLNNFNAEYEKWKTISIDALKKRQT
jgi:hypothetical protein